MQPKKICQIAFHVAGYSSIIGAVLLMLLCFAQISNQGFFKAIEPNHAILYAEVAMSVYSALYAGYIYAAYLNRVVQVRCGGSSPREMGLRKTTAKCT